MKITCGIFLIDNRNRVLLGHPTGSPDSVWSIPKGLSDDGETTWDAAKRELLEETMIDLDHYSYIKKHIGRYKYQTILHKKPVIKELNAFVVYMPHNSIDLSRIRCDSFFGKDNTPEVDKFNWFSIEMMRVFLPYPQLCVWDELNRGLV